MKITEMTGHELRVLLGIESVVDCDTEAFDTFDNAHMRDYRSADDTRRYLIDGLTRIAIVGARDQEDPDLLKILECVKDRDDKIALADELINHETFSAIDIDVTIPDGYTGADGYVEAARLEFIANLSGGNADANELLSCFAM